MPDQRHKSERIQAWITPTLKAHLDQVVRQQHKHNPGYRISDLIRDALRAHLDQQTDILTSRANVTRTVKNHIRDSEDRLAIGLQLIIQMLAITMSILLSHTTEKNVSAQFLIETGLKAVRGEDTYRLLKDIDTIAAARRDGR